MGDFWSSGIFFSSNLVGRIFFSLFFPQAFYYIRAACNFFLPTSACRKFFFKITHPLPQELNGRPLKIYGKMDACQTCSAVIGGHQFHEEEWNDLWLKSLTHNGKSKHKKMTAEMRKIEFAQKCWACEIMSILFSRRETIHYSVSLSVSHKRNNTVFLYW